MIDGVSIAISLATGLFGAGAVWGSVRGKIATLERVTAKHEEKLDEHSRDMHRLQLKEVEYGEKIDRLTDADADRTGQFEQLKESVVTRELFQSETKGQNRRLEDIISRLPRANTPSSGGFRRPDPREDSDPPLPPPRPRLPSRRDGE